MVQKGFIEENVPWNGIEGHGMVALTMSLGFVIRTTFAHDNTQKKKQKAHFPTN